MATLEEAMEVAQASMQRIVDDAAAQAEKANMQKLYLWMIGDFYERIASEKVANLEALHNA